MGAETPASLAMEATVISPRRRPRRRASGSAVVTRAVYLGHNWIAALDWFGKFLYFL
ncbi:hypothetical protein Acor_24180 [Acrocarpospora corrugata]|uniref:Uncharacterized protein n=1 Tax=Acrocarpospora corrugata TaxID=35763 RepID=A0A5M3VV22_9ACTN|nr:hypothetical protein Acor_24180 [Acrocarpospora corrugata]